jgi:hypothetical protein
MLRPIDDRNSISCSLGAAAVGCRRLGCCADWNDGVGRLLVQPVWPGSAGNVDWAVEVEKAQNREARETAFLGVSNNSVTMRLFSPTFTIGQGT